MARHLPPDWMLPELDELNRPFFTSGQLLLQRCRDCAVVQHPPEDVCRQCQSMRFESVEASGSGTIYSYTVVRHPLNSKLVEALPYNVTLVQLDDHPHVRITGNVVDAEPDQLQIGRAVRVVWEEVSDEATDEVYRLPQWRLA